MNGSASFYSPKKASPKKVVDVVSLESSQEFQQAQTFKRSAKTLVKSKMAAAKVVKSPKKSPLKRSPLKASPPKPVTSVKKAVSRIVIDEDEDDEVFVVEKEIEKMPTIKKSAAVESEAPKAKNFKYQHQVICLNFTW